MSAGEGDLVKETIKEGEVTKEAGLIRRVGVMVKDLQPLGRLSTEGEDVVREIIKEGRVT